MRKPNWAVEIARVLNPCWAVEIEDKLQQEREHLRILLGPTVAKLRQDTEHLAQSSEKHGNHALADKLRRADELVAQFG
jgi:hypothetical protein